MELLQKKLAPPAIGRGVLSRPPAMSALKDAAEYPVCLLVAPAGSGKTTLLTTWVEQNTSVAWFSINKEDNDPARFWTYVVAAVKAVCPDLSVSSPFITPEMGSALLTGSLNELSNRLAANGQPIYLVLDNYHQIENAEIHQGISHWIDRQPANAHLVIAARTYPPLRLASLRAKNRVGEVPVEQLYFSSAEIQQFFQMAENRTLSDAQMQIVLNATDGWPAGVRMIALTLRKQKDVQPALVSGNKSVAEFLADEVINDLPEDWQRFMTTAAVAEVMTPELCAVLTGHPDSGVLLEKIEQANLFISQAANDNLNDRYQFQPFFREALLSRLPHKERTELRQKAAAWLVQNGSPEHALRQALAGEGWDTAAHLILDLAETRLQQGEIRTIESWLQTIPDTILKSQNALQVLQGWVLYLTGQVPEALKLEQQLLENGTAFEPPQKGWWLGLRCELALVQEQNAQAVGLAKTALDAISEGSLFFRGMLLNALASAQQATGDSESAVQSLRQAVDVNRRTGNLIGTTFAQGSLGIELNTQGKRNRAEVVCREAIEALRDEQGHNPPQAGILFLLLAQLLREANQLEAATDALQTGMEMIERLGIPGLELSGLLVQAQILAAQENDPASTEALRVLNRAVRLSRSAEFTGFRRLFELLRAEICLKNGSLARVENWLEEADLPEQIEDDPAREGEFLLRARYRMQIGQLNLAQAELKQLESFARQALHHRLLIQVLLAQVVADWKQGQTSALKPKLGEVIRLAVPEHYLRILLDEGAPVLGLLAQLPGAPAEIRALFCSQDKVAVPALSETLTAREIDVLRLLAENQTNAEIAQRLVLSGETVKVHLKHIFQKLDVTDRRQAVQQARALGLID